MKSYKMSLNGTELIYDINEHCVLLGNRRLQLNGNEKKVNMMGCKALKTLTF